MQSMFLDTYDATYNPYGNLLTNGLFWTGSGGNNGATGLTGVIPSGFTIIDGGVGTGGSAVASVVASSDGIGQWFQLAFSGAVAGGSTGAVYYLYQAQNESGMYAPGDVLESWCNVSVSANSPFNQLTMTLVEQNKDNSKIGGFCGFPGLGSAAPLANGGVTYAWSGVLRSAPFVVPGDAIGSGTRQFMTTLAVGFDSSPGGFNSGAFSGTVKFRRWTVRKVPQT
jgi:hypothetical protein